MLYCDFKYEVKIFSILYKFDITIFQLLPLSSTLKPYFHSKTIFPLFYSQFPLSSSKRKINNYANFKMFYMPRRKATTRTQNVCQSDRKLAAPPTPVNTPKKAFVLRLWCWRGVFKLLLFVPILVSGTSRNWQNWPLVPFAHVLCVNFVKLFVDFLRVCFDF